MRLVTATELLGFGGDEMKVWEKFSGPQATYECYVFGS